MSKKEKTVYTVLGIFLALLMILNTLWLWLLGALMTRRFQDPYIDYPALATQRGSIYVLADDAVYIRTDRVYLDPQKAASGEIRIYSAEELLRERGKQPEEYGAIE